MRQLPRYTGEVGGLTVQPGTALLYRDTAEAPWVLKIWEETGWHTIGVGARCVCHPITGPCEASINDTAQRILRGDHPDIYKPETK